MLEIKAIGIGGIGCALLPFLCRYLQYSNEPARVTLIDGDRFERNNAARQAFSGLGNKAEVKAGELAREYEAVAFRSKPEYVTEENAARLIGEGEVVFLMVDNHASRHLVSRHVSSLSDLSLISGGNDYEDGNVQVTSARKAWISPPRWPAITLRSPPPRTGIPPPCPARNSWRPAPPNCSSPISWWRP